MRRRQESPWRFVLDSALDAVVVIDVAGEIVEWNDSATSLFGWTRSEAIGRPMAELIVPPRLREAHRRGLERFLATGEARARGRRLELDALRKSGEEFPIELSISAQAEPDRLLFVGFLRDLSARRQAEQALRATEERFATAFNAAAHSMSISTLREGRILAMNAAALAASGRKRDEIVGRTIKELGLYDDPESPRRIRDILLKQGSFKDIEMTFRRKRGPRTYLLSGSLVELQGEQCVLLSAVDITERKQAEQHVRLLMREMNHRANNLFSVVLSIVEQTGAAYGDQRISDRIAERIRGLTASSELLLGGGQVGADFGALLKSQLAPFTDMARVRAAGPPLRLNAAAVQAVGMALHELATNAVKHGALSVATGSIDVEWSLEGEGTPELRMSWREQGGPAVVAPQRSGFGRVVIEQMVSHAVGGRAVLAFEPGGLVWTLRCPADRALEAQAGTASSAPGALPAS